jgi:hypothetical protein
METLLTFVLGALCGLFLIGMVYAFIGVLKMQKEIKKLQSDIRHYSSKLNTVDHEIHARITKVDERAHRRIDETQRDRDDQIVDFRREVDNRFEETYRLMGANNSEAHQRADEAFRYIDSRIDKAVTVLIQRMDMMFERKPEFENTPKAQEEMLKS